jgi:myo-inositol-1-phosphate synthase
MHQATMHQATTDGNDPRDRTGLWLVGARGSVATTATLGLAALAEGIAPATGCVTAGPAFEDVPLPAYGDLVVGGHDVSPVPMPKRAESLVEAGMIPPRFLAATHHALEAADADIRTGYDPAEHRGSQQDAADRLAADITAFRERHRLARVVVVDV